MAYNMSSITIGRITYQSKHSEMCEHMDIDEALVPSAPTQGQKRLRSSSFEHPSTDVFGSVRFLRTPLSGSSTVRTPKKRRIQYLEPEELNSVQSSIDALSQAVQALACKSPPRLTIRIPARSPSPTTISTPTTPSPPASHAISSGKPRMAYQGLTFRWPENKPTLIPHPIRGLKNEKPLTIRIRAPKSSKAKATKKPQSKQATSPKFRIRIRTMLRLELGLRSLGMESKA